MSENNSGFKTVEKSEAWVPNELGDFLLGAVEELGAKDNNPKSKFLVVRTKEMLRDADSGEPIVGELKKADGTVATDGEGKPLTGIQYKDKLFRVTDAATVREFEKRVGKTYDPSRSKWYVSLVVTGFLGEKRWPDHELAFAEGANGPRAMRAAANEKAGVYYVHHPRPQEAKSSGSSAAQAPTGPRTAMDDIPF